MKDLKEKTDKIYIIRNYAKNLRDEERSKREKNNRVADDMDGLRLSKDKDIFCNNFNPFIAPSKVITPVDQYLNTSYHSIHSIKVQAS